MNECESGGTAVLETRNAVIIIITTLFYMVSLVHVQKVNTCILNDLVIEGKEDSSCIICINIHRMLMILFALEIRGTGKGDGSVVCVHLSIYTRTRFWFSHVRVISMLECYKSH